MWSRWVFVLALAVLQGCTLGQVATLPNSSSELACTPIDPRAEVLPADPCFRAVRYSGNEILLQWRVIHSIPAVYIYDDTGHGGGDVGTKPAFCPSAPANICSTSLTVTEGGNYRWLLRVENSKGRKVYVPASITLTPPYAPEIVAGGGFVDILAPSKETISWVADQRNAPAGESTDDAWIEIKPPGAFWFKADRLPRSGPAARISVPASALGEPGRSVYSIRDCLLQVESGTKFCSGAVSIGFSTASDRFLNPDPIYSRQAEDLEISFTTQSGDVRRLYSKTLLPREYQQSFLETQKASYTVDAGLLTPGNHRIELASCQRQTNHCSPKVDLQILVQPHNRQVRWTLDREYTDDFLPGRVYAQLGDGEPLDITYDTAGGVWMINEFSTTIEHLTPQGIVESFKVPLARKTVSSSSSEFVKPFAAQLKGLELNPVSFSMLAERATTVGSTIWFTQGGGMWAPAKLPNHARIISYDPSKADSPVTPFDDRICVYNVPADDEEQFGDNQVVGLTAAKGRIWIGESRGFYDNRPSAISSFIPDPENCANLLNFDNPNALASQRLQYCVDGKTPEQDGCMQKYLLDKLPVGIKVAHLATDPGDGSVWFTDAHGRFLGNLNTDRAEVMKVYPLPDPHPEMGMFGGFPWTIRADDDAVYFGQYATKSVLRFDKASASFDEILVPVALSQVRLHSIDIDAATNRLWFTLTNESPVPVDQTASTIGYIDLHSWRDHIADPGKNSAVYGVVYKGLSTLPASAYNPGQHQAFRGIAVDPASGKIALATMRRNQITELSPQPGFWP
jgi:hypothetical protein